MARRINLVPQQERARTHTDIGMLGLGMAIVIVLFALGYGYYTFNNTRGDREKELTDVKQQTQLVLAQITSLKQYEDLATKRKDAEELVQQVYAGRTVVSDVLQAMSLVVPENVWFDKLNMTTADPTPTIDSAGKVTTKSGDNKLELEGSTYSFEDVAQFLTRLQLIGGLSGIDLDSASSEDETSTVKTFSINAALDGPDDAESISLPMSQVEVEGL